MSVIMMLTMALSICMPWILIPENQMDMMLSRRKRIAKGSGTTVQQVNLLLKSYVQVHKMIKKLNKGGLRTLGRGGLPF